jgi:hypothetical protein
MISDFKFQIFDFQFFQFALAPLYAYLGPSPKTVCVPRLPEVASFAIGSCLAKSF